MSAPSLSWFDDSPRDIARWAIAGAVVVGIYAGAAAYLLATHQPDDIGAASDVVTVELAPIDSTPDAKEQDVAPAPETMVESQPLPDLPQILAQFPDRGHQLLVPLTATARITRGRKPRHEMAAFLPRHDHALGTEHADAMPHGHRGHAVPLRQLALDGQTVTDRIPARHDPGAQVVSDLHVRGDRAVAANRHGQRLPSPATRALLVLITCHLPILL